MPPYTRVPPCSAMPFMIAPMACSRTPKWSVRPYGPPDHILVCRSAGRNEAAPLTAVLLLSARSAEPPHSSGRTGYRAARTSPEAFRVATPFGSASQAGRVSAQPSGSVRADSRSSSAPPSGLPARHASKRCCHRACACLPRTATRRACSSTSGATSKVLSGSKPRMSLVARTSSSPSADPWAAPVFCLFGEGQPMIVRSTISDGRPVSAWAAASARSTAARSSPSSTCCTCQP